MRGDWPSIYLYRPSSVVRGPVSVATKCMAVRLCSTTDHAPAAAGLRTTLPAICLPLTAYPRSLTHRLDGGLPVEGQLVEVYFDLEHGYGPSRGRRGGHPAEVG